MGELLRNNIFFIYLLGIIVIANYSSFTKQQKIAIIYVCTFGLTFGSEVSSWLVLAMMLASLFIYEEYLDTDAIKRSFAYKISDKIIDFLYMYVTRYNILYMIAAILLRSDITAYWEKYVRAIEGMELVLSHIEIITCVISILCIILGIHLMFENPVNFYVFEQMYNKFRQYPYYLLPFHDVEKCGSLFTKLEMVAAMEDYTFFIREKSYSSFSLEFLLVWLQNRGCKRERKTRRRRRHFSWRGFWKAVRRATRYIKRNGMPIRKIIGKTAGIVKRRMQYAVRALLGTIKSKMRRFFRGYSTIEMQLIRILAYEKGLVLGRPHSLNEGIEIFKRKAFEVFYAKIFFRGLKRYLMIHNTKASYFRYYIVYIYLHTVQTTLNGKRFAPLDKVFNGIDIWEWPKEALFVILLGLNSLPITEERARLRWDVIEGYQLEWELIQKLIRSVNSGSYRM